MRGEWQQEPNCKNYWVTGSDAQQFLRAPNNDRLGGRNDCDPDRQGAAIRPGSKHPLEECKSPAASHNYEFVALRQGEESLLYYMQRLLGLL
jgi:hypothetical protein